MRRSKIPGVAALLPDTPDGCCAFCQETIPPERSRGRVASLHCGGVECARSYHRLYRHHRTERAWASGVTTQGKPLLNVRPGSRAASLALHARAAP